MRAAEVITAPAEVETAAAATVTLPLPVRIFSTPTTGRSLGCGSPRFSFVFCFCYIRIVLAVYSIGGRVIRWEPWGGIEWLNFPYPNLCTCRLSSNRRGLCIWGVHCDQNLPLFKRQVPRTFEVIDGRTIESGTITTSPNSPWSSTATKKSPDVCY